MPMKWLFPKGGWQLSGLLALACLAAFGCSASTSTAPATQQTSILPEIQQSKKSPRDWAQFVPNTTGSRYLGVAGVQLGVYIVDMFVADTTDDSLIKISMSGGSKSRFGLGSGFQPGYMTVGDDGLLYVGSLSTPNIGRVNPRDGHLTLLPIPNGEIAGGIIGTYDAFFTTKDALGLILYPSGTVFTINYPTAGGGAGGLTLGPNAAIWFTEPLANKVAYYYNSVITELSLDAYGLTCNPQSIAMGSDGNLWFDCGTLLARMTAGGSLTTFANPLGFASSPNAIVSAPDGRLWFPTRTAATIGAFDTNTLKLTTYTSPYATDVSNAIVVGPDKNLWMTTVGSRNIDVHVLQVINVTPKNLSLSGVGQSQTITVSEIGTTQWGGATADKNIATIAHGSSNDQFVVTATGIGKTTLTISDFIGNSYKLKVTVN